ncbi:ABC transporter ATP-binding protein [Boudabousia marimammalium]|uniref:ABC transporter n=1 Tax=Boudabousia marimammalium TaxID=156892 RepID=A0A1Q5PRY0_9ACTO|nr:ABC transporter ATP-binding protein [Boudabousia marimammalium]OKL50337.1 ABC transporter [Boudabousia marimammalium]
MENEFVSDTPDNIGLELPAQISPSPQVQEKPHSEIALSIRGLVKVFGDFVACAGMNLDIPAGSFYGIVGPNGAGKTTMLSMATCMLTPTAGTALVHGVDIWKDSAYAKRTLGILPDGVRTFDRLSGGELVTYTGLLHGMEPEVVRSRTTDLLQALGLDTAGDKLVMDYSAGMRKKILLACALVHSPSVLVLDEPFEAVDPISAKTILNMLNHFRSRGGTVILSSHVMDTVARICSHVAVINQGQVVASGTLAEVEDGMDLFTRFENLVGARSEGGDLAWLAPSSN